MCLIALAWKTHPRYPLALIANRDEFHARPTAAAGPDPDASDVYGGRDLVQGGGWLQVARRGRLAAVTNVRCGIAQEPTRHSRGWLVRDFVRNEDAAATYVEDLQSRADDYGRFNLLVWDGGELAFASNHPRPAHRQVCPGVHAMSNGAFDAPWPKSTHATKALEAWLGALPPHGDPFSDHGVLVPLFDALADCAPAPDAALPDTGVGLALERALSPPFVTGAEYGTRCSSVVLVEASRILFAERRFAPGGATIGESVETLRVTRESP
ncbi:NRDE family protein [Luteimonas sp. RD2P54]|uniref:NRDE family protein n=1 Tax=Luteimonas endophytica TaxID=3042023 RepID=A0ABT6J9J5_9GAMM|nr:NRDE family protein [Luteimonas endophytica]MDH5823494.1 NRDE family protein [Luteimonas endophytica]